jgi:DNA-binding NtrC family response regulator
MNYRYIEKVLKTVNGKGHGKGGAAELLKVNANTLRNKMNKLGIDYKKR